MWTLGKSIIFTFQRLNSWSSRPNHVCWFQKYVYSIYIYILYVYRKNCMLLTSCLLSHMRYWRPHFKTLIFPDFITPWQHAECTPVTGVTPKKIPATSQFQVASFHHPSQSATLNLSFASTIYLPAACHGWKQPPPTSGTGTWHSMRPTLEHGKISFSFQFTRFLYKYTVSVHRSYVLNITNILGARQGTQNTWHRRVYSSPPPLGTTLLSAAIVLGGLRLSSTFLVGGTGWWRAGWGPSAARASNSGQFCVLRERFFYYVFPCALPPGQFVWIQLKLLKYEMSSFWTMNYDSLLTCSLQTTLKCCGPDWWTRTTAYPFSSFFTLYIYIYLFIAYIYIL